MLNEQTHVCPLGEPGEGACDLSLAANLEALLELKVFLRELQEGYGWRSIRDKGSKT